MKSLNPKKINSSKPLLSVKIKLFTISVGLLFFSFLFPAQAQVSAPAQSSKTKVNEFAKHVRAYKKNYSYTGEFDTSKFRLMIQNSDYSPKNKDLTRSLASTDTIAGRLLRNPSDVCVAVKDNAGLKFSNSPVYVVSALKKARAIDFKDKEYSLDSAHHFWEMYLAYRGFVDISAPLSRDGAFSFSKLPNGAIVTLENGCNPNGLAAIHCDGKYYAPRFVDTKKLEARLNNPKDLQCKIGRGFRVVAEAKRFL